jgi:hypothetical protein
MTKPRKLPLDDSRWLPLRETLQYCRMQPRPLFRIVDLVAAVRQEKIASKLEYLDTRSQPAQRKALLLTKDFFKHDADIVLFMNGLGLEPRRKGIPSPHTLSFWGPDLKKYWPAPPAASTKTDDRVRPGPKPKDDWPRWVASWLVLKAKEYPSELQNVDMLVKEAREVLNNENIFLPKDDKAVRKVLTDLLIFIRRR